MNTIAKLLGRYALETVMGAFKMRNNRTSSSKGTVDHPKRNNDALAVELGKDNKKERIQTRTYEPGSRSLRSHLKPTIANLKAQKETARANEPMELPPTNEQLDFKEFQQMNFREFRAAWGARKGEANYNALYDFDNNGVIDMVDYLAFGKKLQSSFNEFNQAYGSRTEDGNFDSRYDYDSNGLIDMKDYLAFGKNWIA
jgi:hypothetical protein